MPQGRALLASVLEFLLRLLRWLAVVGLIGVPLSIVGGWAFLHLAPRWGIVVDMRSVLATWRKGIDLSDDFT